MEERKYILIGGEIESRNDGDIHYITAGKLRRLYNLSSFQCWSLEDNNPMERDVVLSSMRTAINEGKIQILRPKYNGDYKLSTLSNP